MEYAETALVQKLEEDPRWAEIICDGFVKLKCGFWSPDYVAVIMDRWGGSTTFGDVYCFLQVHAMLSSGRVLRTGIEVGAGPYSDRFRAENNRLLANLPRPFSGKFLGGQGDSDGSIKWSKPIEADGILHDGEVREAMIPPGRAPLEVGYTTAETTLRHLRMSGSLARWPYDAHQITILHLVERTEEEQL